MIKINLISEGRGAVRGAGDAGAALGGETPANLNNQLIVVFAIIGLLVGGGYWFKKNGELSDVKEKVAAADAEAKSLQKIIDEVAQFKARKEQLQTRIDTIDNLKKNQKVPVLIMDRVSQDLPDLLWLDRMTLAGNLLTVDGRALNPNAVAIFTDNLKQDPLFSEPNVSSVTLQGANVYGFAMTFSFIPPAPPAEEGEAPGDPAMPAGG